MILSAPHGAWREGISFSKVLAHICHGYMSYLGDTLMKYVVIYMHLGAHRGAFLSSYPLAPPQPCMVDNRGRGLHVWYPFLAYLYGCG